MGKADTPDTRQAVVEAGWRAAERDGLPKAIREAHRRLQKALRVAYLDFLADPRRKQGPGGYRGAKATWNERRQAAQADFQKAILAAQAAPGGPRHPV